MESNRTFANTDQRSNNLVQEIYHSSGPEEPSNDNQPIDISYELECMAKPDKEPSLLDNKLQNSLSKVRQSKSRVVPI